MTGPNGTIETVDHAARQAAAMALQKIDAHEDRCGERWKEARNQLREARDEIRGVRSTSRSTLIVLIGWGLMALFFFLERIQ